MPPVPTLAGARISVVASASSADANAGSTASVVAPRLTLTPFGCGVFGPCGAAVTPTAPTVRAARATAITASAARGPTLTRDTARNLQSELHKLKRLRPPKVRGL